MGIAIIVFLLLLVIGFVVVWYGIGFTVTRRLHRIEHETAKMLGMIVGLAASIGWVMLLAALDGATATAYALAFFGAPVLALVSARAARR